MRATMFETPNCSRATRAEMMLELSPLDTAAKPSAFGRPACSRTSRSNPMPVTVMPLNDGPRRRNASGFESMTAVVCPRSSRLRVSVAPTRPQPMITMCTVRRYTAGRAPISGSTIVAVGIVDVTKRALVGRKLRSSQLEETLLPKRVALPVFASDALSSVAYAPDEIFLTLSLGGLTAYQFNWRIGLAVALVLLTVVASYRQNVRAYPSGGGDYEVATVNLGRNAGLTVGSALLVDYVLTVAVSISAAAANIGALVPFVAEHKVLFAVSAIAVLTAINLRGIRESGTAFAIPVYA